MTATDLAEHPMLKYAWHVEFSDDGLVEGDGGPPILVPFRVAIDGHDITPILPPVHGSDSPRPRWLIESGDTGTPIIELAVHSDAVTLVSEMGSGGVFYDEPHITAPDGTVIVPLQPEGYTPGEQIGGTPYVRVRMFAGRITFAPTGTAAPGRKAPSASTVPANQ